MEQYKSDLTGYMWRLQVQMNKDLNNHTKNFNHLEVETQKIIDKYNQWDEHI